MFQPSHLDHIADSLQTWIDWEERNGPADEDKHIMSPPTWPTFGQVRLWVETLRAAKSRIERMQEFMPPSPGPWRATD